MIQIQDNGIRGYHPEMEGDPLLVEKGYCHYNSNGQKDFLDRILGYEPSETGCTFEAATFRGKTAKVMVSFQGETVFRFRMFPEGTEGLRRNEVFEFPDIKGVTTEEDPLFIRVKTERVTLQFRKSPWEMTILLDGRELTCEQIRDHNVDQKPTSVRRLQFCLSLPPMFLMRLMQILQHHEQLGLQICLER